MQTNKGAVSVLLGQGNLFIFSAMKFFENCMSLTTNENTVSSIQKWLTVVSDKKMLRQPNVKWHILLVVNQTLKKETVSKVLFLKFSSIDAVQCLSERINARANCFIFYNFLLGRKIISWKSYTGETSTIPRYFWFFCAITTNLHFKEYMCL